MKKQRTGVTVVIIMLLVMVSTGLIWMNQKKEKNALISNSTQENRKVKEEILDKSEETEIETIDQKEIHQDNDIEQVRVDNTWNETKEKNKVETEEEQEELKKKPGEGMIIECWGDSLTYGFNGDGVTYPGVLAELSGAEVRNYGVSGETSLGIAGRQGGIPMQVNNITIPASGSLVLGDLYGSGVNSIYGEMERPMVRGGESSVNPCTIAGVRGRLDWTGADYTDKSGTFVFTREAPGEEVAITTPTTIVTSAMADQSEDILVIFVGENGGWESKEDLANQIQAMVTYSVCGGKYVICGLTTGTENERAELEGYMEATFGNKYINLRKYLVEQGLNDAGITPTPEDLGNLESGSVPHSLRSDAIHGNSFYYRLIGEQVYKRILDLGYLK